jgi:hypothetical protein
MPPPTRGSRLAVDEEPRTDQKALHRDRLCPRLGIDTREYLEDVLTRLPSMKDSEAVTLTPGNWLRARQGKPVRQAA